MSQNRTTSQGGPGVLTSFPTPPLPLVSLVLPDSRVQSRLTNPLALNHTDLDHSTLHHRKQSTPQYIDCPGYYLPLPGYYKKVVFIELKGHRAGPSTAPSKETRLTSHVGRRPPFLMSFPCTICYSLSSAFSAMSLDVGQRARSESTLDKKNLKNSILPQRPKERDDEKRQDTTD